MDHTIDLIQKSHEGDEEARARLVEENAGLVWCIVKRFHNRGVETEDLFQIGNIGLIKAIDKFDLSYDVKFSTYAVPMISGEIKRFLRDDGMIKVSRSLKELAYKAYLLKEDLQNQWGREPTVGELSERLGVEQEELVMALDAGGDVESLHKPIYQKDGQEIRLMDKLEEKSEEHEQVLNHIVLTELLGVLNQDEKRLIYLRYFAEQTQSQVGRELGISQVQVSRMEKSLQIPGFAERVFSEPERVYCKTTESFAGIFAAKEAYYKALGTGLQLPLNALTVLHDDRGKPYFDGKRSAKLSISHDGDYAVATVLLLE